MTTPAELELALGYARPMVRPALRALFGLDARLGAIVAATREPQLGLIRLKWWEEALTALPGLQALGGDPLLADLATVVGGHDVTGETLAGLISGWAELLAPLPLDEAALQNYARWRGGHLFAMGASLAGQPQDAARRRGEAWALCDFAARCSDAVTATRALAMADAVSTPRLPRPLAPLAILATWAEMEARGAVSPRRRASVAMRIALLGR